MGRTPLATVIRLVCSLADSAGGHDLADGQLLQRYVRLRDDDAFAVLMQRHGRLVWNVCRRVLRCDADAEDAFQATFLTLARHAATIRASSALASWLYRVAHRVAARAVRERDTRRTRERAAERPAHAQPNDDLSGRELQAVVDEELQRLPTKYQAPFLLCCLEGKSKTEAARQLGWKVGTVSGRLAEARKRMRRHLLRRGVTPSAVATAVTLQPSPTAAVPGPLVENTIRIAAGAVVAPVPAHVARLAEGACTDMSAKKMIVVAILLVCGLAAGGKVWMSYSVVEARAPAELPRAEVPSRAEVPPPAEEPPPPEPPAPRPADRLDLALRRWHLALNRVKTAACEVTRTEKDTDFNKDAFFQGTFRYLRADDCWALEMHRTKDPQDFEKIVSVGKDLYWYAPQTKEVQKYQRPLGWPLIEMASDPFCVLFSGMNPEQARERFEWKFLKEDQWYVYLQFEPKSNKDRATFLSARLVLSREGHLPRQIWFQTSGLELTWDFTKVDTAVELKKEDFAPKVPAGWRITSVERIEAVPGKIHIRSLGLTMLEPNLSAENAEGPGRLNLGTVKAGETVKQRVVVRAAKPFRVVDIEGPPEVTLAPEPDSTPRKVHTLTLEYQPVKPGPFVCQVKFKTDLEETPVVVILEGVVKP
jgi:TIGR03009 family protein